MQLKSKLDWNSKNGLRNINKLNLEDNLKDDSQNDLSENCNLVSSHLVKCAIKSEATSYLREKPNIILVKGSQSLNADYENMLDQSALESMVILLQEFIKSTPEISK